MIPTRKSTIPKTHSYPIGFKAMSDALSGVPQHELLKVEFSFWKSLIRDHGTAIPYQVLCVSYSGPMHLFSGSKSMAEKGRYDAKWAIKVYPVPRPLKHVVQGKLIAEALPKIRDWLISNVHSLEREGSHALTFSFDELKNEITSEETACLDWKTERG